jgi:hypothetical protein
MRTDDLIRTIAAAPDRRPASAEIIIKMLKSVTSDVK